MPNDLMGSLRSRNISQIITERIAASIMNGELRPGQRLPTEEEFAARIGAGKSSVREAIKILEALGVLEIRRGDGTYVVDRFMGSMLDPMVYGILLADKSEDDVMEFKIRVQRMAADSLLQQGREVSYAPLLKMPCATSDDILALETALAQEVDNPLIGELYRQAIRIGARMQAPFAEGMGPLLRRFVQALADNDDARISQLLEEERNLFVLGRDA